MYDDEDGFMMMHDGAPVNMWDHGLEEEMHLVGLRAQQAQRAQRSQRAQ
jgi:hypothetical protein